MAKPEPQPSNNSLFEDENGNITSHLEREYNSNGNPLCNHPGCKKVALNKGKNFGGFRQYCAEHTHGKSPKGSKKPYDKYKQDHPTCENADGRLGFRCPAPNVNEIDTCMTTVDHIDNNHKNNDPDNLQTLCAGCHNYKTKHYGSRKGFTDLADLLDVFNDNRDAVRLSESKSE